MVINNLNILQPPVSAGGVNEGKGGRKGVGKLNGRVKKKKKIADSFVNFPYSLHLQAAESLNTPGT